MCGAGKSDEADLGKPPPGTTETELRAAQKRKLELEIQDLEKSAWTRPATWMNLFGVIIALTVAGTTWIYKSIEGERAQVTLEATKLDLRQQADKTRDALLELEAAKLDLRQQADKTRDALLERDRALAEKKTALQDAKVAKASTETLIAEGKQAKAEAGAQLQLAKEAQGRVEVAQDELKKLQEQIGAIKNEIAASGGTGVSARISEAVDAAADSVNESLKKLTVPQNATDEDLRLLLEQNPDITDLDLAFCVRITDAGVRHLTSCEGLESLSLLGCTGVTNEGMATVGALENLKTLSLNSTLVGNEGLALLDELTALELLQLTDCDSITGAGIAQLRELPIGDLVLDFTDLGDADLEPVASMTSLSTLSLSFTRVTDVGLIHLPKLPQLGTLWLQGCNISDEGLGALHSMSLGTLVVTSSRITCKGLARLADMQSLWSLYAADCPGLLDQELMLLAKLGKLQFLTITQNPQLSQAAIAALKAAMPSCQITSD